AKRVIVFNQNYYVIDDILKEILDREYNEIKVNDALSRLKNTPEIAADIPLGKYKNNVLLLLENYSEVNCSISQLIESLYDNFTKINENPFGEDLIKKFEVNPDYVYLNSVIRDFVKDYRSYTGKRRLPDSCSKEEIKVESQSEKEELE